MNKILKKLPTQLIKKCKKIAQPRFIPPMLATLTQDYFSDKAWLYEKKFDGIRLLAFKHNGRVHLVSRNNIAQNEDFPQIVKALEQQKADNFILDGEVVAFNAHTDSDFQLLQKRMQTSSSRIAYVIFDCLYAQGYDIRPLSLVVRKKILKNMLEYNSVLKYTHHTDKEGVAFFHYACRHGWEGIIAKRRASTYSSKRSRDWLKFKCVLQQEFVIGGYTNPRGSRSHFGALLVGYYEHGKLYYAGKVGTGYSEKTLAMLGSSLKKIETKQCPFTNYDASAQNVHWVRPHLVAECGFAQWTKADKLRVGRFKGLRHDKKASDVVKEKPQHIHPNKKGKL